MTHLPSGSEASYAYEPPTSLWGLVEQHVPCSEWAEVKAILGESLVEQSLELQQEICTLLEIWRDYRVETQQNVFHSRLPEPPAVRDRLKQEIIFFVENIRQKAKESKSDPDAVLAKHNKDLLDYVTRTTARPTSASAVSIMDGRETPRLQGSPCPKRDKDLELESMTHKLGALKMDDIANHLREALEEEVGMLMKDIEFLQKCLDDEADYRSQTNLYREPSLQDLKESRTKLEKELLASDGLLASPIHENPQSSCLASSRPMIRKGSAGSIRSTLSSAGSLRSRPVKGSHMLSPSNSSLPVMPKAPTDVKKTVNANYRLRKYSTDRTTSGETSESKQSQDSLHHGSEVTSNSRPLHSARPSSADKFRNMVLKERDSS